MEDTWLGQTIKGQQHRIAGNDYIENNVVHLPTLEQWLAWAPMAEQDKVCANNETLFKRRFGFDVPKQQRRHAVAVKNWFDFTDWEIRELKRSRLFTLVKGKPTSLCADVRLFWLTVIEVIFHTLVFGGLALLINFQVSEPFPRFVGVMFFLSIYFLLLTMHHKLSIKPLMILRQRGIKLGESYIFVDDNGNHKALIEKMNRQKKPSTVLIHVPDDYVYTLN